MRKFKLFAIVMVLGFAVISCDEKDEDVQPSVSGNKYESSYAKVGITNDTTNVTVSVEYKTTEELTENGYYKEIEFKSDGKYFEDGVEAGTWKQEDLNIDVTLENGDRHLGSQILNKILIHYTIETVGASSTIELEYTQI